MKTEWQKMVEGELYDPRDPELVAARSRARAILRAYNLTDQVDSKRREYLLRRLLGGMGKEVWIEPPFFCDYGTNIVAGDRVFLNFNCVILDVCRVTLGDDVFIGPAVQVYAADHLVEARRRREDREFGRPVRIGADVWIGGGVIILPGVTIGPRSVVGAGSVVTSDIPADVVAAGNPCRVLRRLS
ncbi:MAG: sugar O-acetyltransferase [Thermoleophilia bacterium]